MTHITREQLMANLAKHDTENETRLSNAWARLMTNLDTATKQGRRSVSFAWGGGEYSLEEATYIKERAKKEGMKVSQRYSGADDYDGYVFIEIGL